MAAKAWAVRPLVLWACAAILGVAAGLNYVRLSLSSVSAYAATAQSRGFDSAEDFLKVGDMLDNPRIRSLTTEQLALLTKYSTGRGVSCQYVAGVLEHIVDDGTAQKTVPMTAALFQRIPEHPILQGLAKTWDRNACHRAAAALRAYQRSVAPNPVAAGN